MEKNKTFRLIINEVVSAKSKDGTKSFFKVDTSIGHMSCWDKALALELYAVKGQEVMCEVSEKGDFKTIRALNPFQAQVGDIPNEIPKEVPKQYAENAIAGAKENYTRKSVKGSAYEKDPVGLAVEVFNVMATEKMIDEDRAIKTMNLAINLVKQAQEGFK